MPENPVRLQENDGRESIGMVTKPTAGDRRTRILAALKDGEFRIRAIAAWADVADQQARADLRWLEREGFAHHGERDDDGGYWWNATDQGHEYIAGLSDEEKSW